MSILTKKHIKENQDKFVLENVTENQFAQNSVDLSLGEFIFIDKSARFYPPSFEEFNLGETVIAKNEKAYYKLSLKEFDDTPIVLYPGMFILAYSDEWFGVKPNQPYAWHNLLKSTSARNGLQHLNAGFVESGYFQPLCFEFVSFVPVPLRHGDLVCQAVVHTTTDDSVNYTEKGTYQSTNDIDELKKNWKPENILPGKIKNKFDLKY
jgi:deoxycytidine triphosphate deaminase